MIISDYWWKPPINIGGKMKPDSAWRTALWLSIITIGYNIGEGLISIYFGISDDTLALLGFGVDSFVEVISGIGILHMLMRMKYAKVSDRDSFEKLALKITGFSFYLLATGLTVSAIHNIIVNARPETTVVGIIISILSIATMYFLMSSKLKVGIKLNSDAIIADAHCTRTCLQLSVLLLISSGLYELFSLGYVDALGSLGIAWFAYKEGREAFEKIKSGQLRCSCDHEIKPDSPQS